MAHIKLANGRVLDTVTKKLVDEVTPEADTLPESTFVPAPKATYRLEELPADSKQMSVICAILGYRFLGVPDTDICIALNCDMETLNSITVTEAYERSNKMMIDAFIAGQTNAARDIITKNAKYAATTLVEVMHKGKMADRRAAASDLLNRAGIGDQSDGGMSNGLVIKVVRDADAHGISIKIGG